MEQREAVSGTEHQLSMKGDYSADVEPVVWVQRGTFGYINKHSNSTGYQSSPLLH